MLSKLITSNRLLLSRRSILSPEHTVNFSVKKGPDNPKKSKPLSAAKESKKYDIPSCDKRIAKKSKCRLPTLTENDFVRRVEFSTIMLERMDRDKTFLPSIVFSDEGNFKLFNIPGTPKNPYKRFKESAPPPIIVWCGMTSKDIIGPYFFNSFVTENSYLIMLKTFLVPRLKELGYSLKSTFYQQDGYPPHRSKKALKYLNNQFGDRLISYGCPTFWPARSQDLTPLDYFLWDHVKAKLENYRPTNEDDMKDSITEELANIDQDLLEKVIFNFGDRLQSCIKQKGRRVVNCDWQHKI